MVKVAFIHPDLGIGGAEQLVVNLALLCKKNTWDVKIITPFFDPQRAFEPCKDGTLKVEVHGNWFPRRIFGKFQALCEYIRMFIASLYLIFFGGSYDLVIVDQIPISIPLLRLRYKVFFYCHFPDKLLCTERKNIFKKIYRLIIDLTEEICILFSSVIVVNSLFTQSVFKSNFKILNLLRAAPEVLYPCSDFSFFEGKTITKGDLLKVPGLERLKTIKEDDITKCKFLVSLNRYERKKNLELAVDAFIEFMKKIDKTEKDHYYLIVAGGYDSRLSENIEVYTSLINKDFQGFKENVFFLRSISGSERNILLNTADMVIYTPKNEHFGIVPCEAMYCGAPVIAHKSGGPIESVPFKENLGYLIETENPKDWGFQIRKYFSEKAIEKNVLRSYVNDKFSLSRMNKDMLIILNNKWKGVFKEGKKD